MPPEGGTRRDGEERLDLALGPSGEDDGLEVATVPVPCAQGARLHAKWGPGHFLRLVDCLPEGATGGRGGATATSLRWFRPSESMRKVGYDVQLHYERIQRRQAVADAERIMPGIMPPGGDWVTEVQSYCRTVSEIMGRDDDIREPPPQLTVEELESGGAVTEEEPLVAWQRAVWELLEVFFVDKGSSRDIIAEDLGQWLRRNWAVLGLASVSTRGSEPGSSIWADLRKEAGLGGTTSAGLETHPGYWSSVHRAVALGWAGMAEDLLSWHSAWRRSKASAGGGRDWEPEVGALEAVQSLARSMPHFCREGSVDITGRAFHDLSEFLQYRQRWVGQCQQFLYMEEFAETWEACAASCSATAEGLRVVLQILAGEEEALKAATCCWLELLVSEILHCYPHLKPQIELRAVLNRCLEMSTSGPSEPWGGMLQRLMEAAADADAQTVIAQLQEGPGLTPWFLCHVSDMLATAGSQARAMLRRPLEFHGCTQVEHYTLDYAMSLMPYSSTWQLAAHYLAWCPSHGLPALRLLLERLPLSVRGGDSVMARKALSICKRHGEQMSGLTPRLCRTMGLSAYQEGRVGLALEWLLRAHDGRLAGLVVQGLVRRAEAALQNGSTELDMVPGLCDVASLLRASGFSFAGSAKGMGLGTEPHGRGWLEFLLRYQDLYAAVKSAVRDDEPSTDLQNRLLEARDAFFALLRPGVTPHRLWPAVVFKAVPLLELHGARVFSTEDTEVLQKRLVEAQLACSTAKSEAAGVPAMQLHVARLALVRNMARTHIARHSGATATAQ